MRMGNRHASGRTDGRADAANRLDLQIARFDRELAAQRGRLLTDGALCAGLLAAGFGDAAAPAQVRAAQALDQLIADARSSLLLIDGAVGRDAQVLEVGGGVGLTYGWLTRLGVRVTSLEPAQSGHAHAYQTGQRLLSLLGISDAGYLPLCAHDAPSLGQGYDLIFSNNVLEHLSDLRGSLDALRRCLRPGGIMRHSCPNYLVPYEPHFGLPLPPLWPRLLARVRRDLQDSELWRELNFVSSLRLWRLAQQLGLQIDFDRDPLYLAFVRLGQDESFARKHPWLHRVGTALDGAGVLPLLRWVPPTLATPMQVTLRHG